MVERSCQRPAISQNGTPSSWLRLVERSCRRSTIGDRPEWSVLGWVRFAESSRRLAISYSGKTKRARSRWVRLVDGVGDAGAGRSCSDFNEHDELFGSLAFCGPSGWRPYTETLLVLLDRTCQAYRGGRSSGTGARRTNEAREGRPQISPIAQIWRRLG